MHECQCQAPGCLARCGQQVTQWLEDGSGVVQHLCAHHFEQIMAEAARRNILVIDKRGMRRDE